MTVRCAQCGRTDKDREWVCSLHDGRVLCFRCVQPYLPFLSDDEVAA